MSYTAMKTKCEECGKEFRAYPDRKGSSGKYPRFCSRGCYAKSRSASAATRGQQLIRLPIKFMLDHSERDLDTPEIVRHTKSHWWVDAADPALSELLNDAEFYSHPYGPDAEWLGGLKASARATVRAIRDVVGWDDAEPAIMRLRKGGAE